jgi:hypothetical protein
MIGIHDHITAPTPNRDHSFGVLGKRRFNGFDTMDLQIRCCNSTHNHTPRCANNNTIQFEADLQPFFLAQPLDEWRLGSLDIEWDECGKGVVDQY